MRKTIKELTAALESQGWTVARTGGGHLRCVPPDRDKPIVVMSATPSDHRSLRNTIARLRQSGFEVNARGGHDRKNAKEKQ